MYHNYRFKQDTMALAFLIVINGFILIAYTFENDLKLSAMKPFETAKFESANGRKFKI